LIKGDKASRKTPTLSQGMTRLSFDCCRIV
jgi:hypothetical protein